MPLDNPTFSESWYRVAQLRPRLRATVQVHRQHFRGQLWHVLQDPGSNEFFRLHEAAYHFVGMLDGRRTVSEAWAICNTHLGDDSLTQNEVVQVLGQLYAANLLLAELPPDAEGLFQRYRKRKRREVQSKLTNVLFLRIPLFDPDAMLDNLVGVVGLAFTPVGFVLWAAVVATGAQVAFSSAGELTSQAEALLNARQLLHNLPLLYLAFVAAKVVHELGHAFACKKFGRQAGSGGEVHVMGIMFLVFAPMPYVDASSAWAFRRKLHRTIVGAAGMMAELALAAVAAIVWSATAGSGEPWARAVHAFAYRLMFIASIATLLFNANPLLRFDGYYILSDLLEIPNLSDRARRYVYYVVRRYAWGVRQALNPAQGRGEAAWLLVYGIASTLFRVYICVRILLMLADRFFLIGSILAAAAVVTWVLLPLGRFVRYLVSSPELARARARAVLTTAAVFVAAAAGAAMIRAPDHWQVEGTVQAERIAFVHAGADGFVTTVLPSGRAVRGEEANGGGGTLLVAAANRDMDVELSRLLHERDALLARLGIARRNSAADQRYLALVQIIEKDIEDLDRQVELLRKDKAALSVRAPLSGTWISRRAERLGGAYVRRGERLGMVADLKELIIRAAPDQRVAGMLLAEGSRDVQIRLSGRPGTVLRGRIRRALPAARRAPRAAAAAAAGHPAGAGGLAGPHVEEDYFEVHITPLDASDCVLLPGQRVVVQFDLPARPLAAQWWRSLRQMAQQRFRI